jgi:hypothetical protein
MHLRLSLIALLLCVLKVTVQAQPINALGMSQNTFVYKSQQQQLNDYIR